MLLKKAVLIIHGFAGGTYDEEYLANYLELKGFDVYTFTLPGHDRMLFNKITKEDWIESARIHLEMLINNKYKQIYVIGHSMGGILASYLAANYKEVKKIVLAAPAFKYLTFEEEDFKFLTALKNSPKIFKDYQKEEIISRLIQFPKSVIKEFMDLVKISRDIPSKIYCPTLIIEGTKDIIVPAKSATFVYDNLSSTSKHIMYLDGVTHDIFRSEKKLEACIAIEKFLKYGVFIDEKDM